MFGKLVEECTETVEEVKLAKITSAENKNKHKCSSCTLYIAFFSITFTINVGISTHFIYFHWYLNKDVIHVKFGTRTQQSNELIMGKVKQIEIKNWTYYFHKDMINIKEFDSNWLKVDKKSYKDIDIYYIGYMTIKKIGNCENIYSVNPLYLIIGKVDGHIGCEKNKNKYLVFDSADENKEVLKKLTELWDGIKNDIETINDGKKGEYDKDFMKTKFNADDNLALNKPLKLHLLTIIVRCIFEEDGKFYPQLYLDDCLYELCV